MLRVSATPFALGERPLKEELVRLLNNSDQQDVHEAVTSINGALGRHE